MPGLPFASVTGVQFDVHQFDYREPWDMDAREYMETLGESAARVRQIGRDIEHMRNDESWRTAAPVAVTGGSVSDPTAARAARHIESIRRKVEELKALAPTVREGVAVCDGTSRAIGERYGRTLLLRYAHGMRWADVAARMGCTIRTCHLRHDVALDYIEDVGLARALRGLDRGEG